MTISLKNIGGLLLSLSIAAALLYYGHEGLEAELARPNRTWYVIAFYGCIFVAGLFVAPTIRSPLETGGKAAAKLYSMGRRAYDGKAVTNEIELPPPETKS